MKQNAGIMGLVNGENGQARNRCYFNSVLQSMSSINELNQQIINNANTLMQPEYN